jgi:hypothetical protein
VISAQFLTMSLSAQFVEQSISLNLLTPTVPFQLSSIAIGSVGPIGPRGLAGGSAITVTAGQDVGGHRAVVLNASDQALYADQTNPHHVNRLVGVTTGAASAGGSVSIVSHGNMVEPTWNWTVDSPVFLGANGLLTQTPPISGFLQIVGMAVSPTTLFVTIRDPIILN